MAILAVLIFGAILIGLKLAALIYFLNRDKKAQIPSIDEDVLDGRI